MKRKLTPPSRKILPMRKTRTRLFVEPELAALVGEPVIQAALDLHAQGATLEPMTIARFGRGYRTRCRHAGIHFWIVTFLDVDLDGEMPTVAARPAHITSVLN